MSSLTTGFGALGRDHDGGMTERRDQTVLTTGANSGIGLATVLEVARRGYRTVGTVRSQSKADVLRGRGE